MLGAATVGVQLTTTELTCGELCSATETDCRRGKELTRNSNRARESSWGEERKGQRSGKGTTESLATSTVGRQDSRSVGGHCGVAGEYETAVSRLWEEKCAFVLLLLLMLVIR